MYKKQPCLVQLRYHAHQTITCLCSKPTDTNLQIHPFTDSLIHYFTEFEQNKEQLTATYQLTIEQLLL